MNGAYDNARPTMADVEPDSPLVEIFFSHRLADCEPHILTLSAVGIHTWTRVRDGGFALLVTENALPLARKHLEEMAQESLAAQQPVAEPAPVVHGHAWAGSVLYSLVLVIVAYAAGIDAFGLDWRSRGAIGGTIAGTGEWWRVFTALTLHADVAHLVGNVVFGVVLGYFVSLAMGGGVAWAGIVFAAGLGNALDALVMPASHSAIGASTAVFAALGLLSAHARRRGGASGLRRVKQWAPLIAGVMLLAFTGMAGENTDIVAHVAGFLCGAIFGAVLGRVNEHAFRSRGLQIVTGVVACLAIAAAWICALIA